MLKIILLIIILTISVFNDLRFAKIRNVYTYPCLIIGVVINLYIYGFEGFITSIIGIAIPILILGIFFFTRQIGAGDIKLFSAIGSLMGPEFIIYSMTYSFLVAAVIALIKAAKSSEIKMGVLMFYKSLKACFLTRGMVTINMDKVNIIKLSPAIFIGTCLETYALYHN